MCFDPISATVLAASTAASVGGGMMARGEANRAQQREANVRRAKLQEYEQRQTGYQQQAGDAFNKTTEAMRPEAQQKQQAADETARVDAAANLTPTAQSQAGEVPISGSAPQVVQGEIAKRMLEAHDAATSRAQAAAKMSSFGDSLFQNGLVANDAGRHIDTINNFSRGDIANLPASQDFAARAAYKPPSGFGEILQSVGKLGAAAAGGGMFAPGSTAGGGIASLFNGSTTPDPTYALRMGYATPLQRA